MTATIIIIQAENRGHDLTAPQPPYETPSPLFFSKADNRVPGCPEKHPRTVSLCSEEDVGQLSGFRELVPRREEDTAHPSGLHSPPRPRR